MIMKICPAMLTFVVFCCLAAKAEVKTTAISILTTNSNGTRTTTIPPQTTTNSATLKVISSSQATSGEKTTPTIGPPATANTETRTPPSTAGTESTTNESTEPDISTAAEQTVPSRRPPSSGDTESTTNESTEPGTSPAATDIVGVHEVQQKGRVARVNVIYVIAGMVATLIIIGGAITAALFYFRRDRNRSNSEEEGLAVTFSNVKKAVSTPDINRKYGTNNNEHYSEITKPDKRCTSSKTFENRVDEFNAYEEVKDRVNPLYNSSNVPNAYEELKENKNPLYSGSVNTENAKKNNDPVYDRISVWMPHKQRK